MNARDKMNSFLLAFASVVNGLVWGLGAAAVITGSGNLSDACTGLALIVALWGLCQAGGIVAYWETMKKEDQ